MTFPCTPKLAPLGLGTLIKLGFLLAGSGLYDFLVFVETTRRSLKVKLLGGVQKSAKIAGTLNPKP